VSHRGTCGEQVDAARGLSTTLEAKRDRGAVIVLSSHRLHDLAGVRDLYFFLADQQTLMMKAHEISPVGPSPRCGSPKCSRVARLDPACRLIVRRNVGPSCFGWRRRFPTSG
jgi:hypothetical protein